jgi:hypothetical protein
MFWYLMLFHAEPVNRAFLLRQFHLGHRLQNRLFEQRVWSRTMELAKGLYTIAMPNERQYTQARTKLGTFGLDLNVDRALNELMYFRLYIVHIAIQMVLTGKPEATQLRESYAECILKKGPKNAQMFIHRLNGYETLVRSQKGNSFGDLFSIFCMDRIEPSLVTFAQEVINDMVRKTRILIGFVYQNAPNKD